MYWYLFNTALN